VNISQKTIINSIISLSTQIIPILIALIFIPISIKILGNEQFGIYTLIVTFIVLFNYLNFGIAPATTKELAKFLALEEDKRVISIFMNSFFIMIFIGVLFGMIFFKCHYMIATLMIKNRNLINLVSNILYLFTFLSPLIMLVLFLRSVLEAKQNFLVTSLNRAFLNSMIFISPIIIYINKDFNIITIFKFLIVIYIVSTIVLGRIVYFEYLKNKQVFVDIKDTQLLFKIGVWMTLSSIAGIGLYYTDRFIISVIISVTAVAYYVASYDLITRLNIISGSITSALFPSFSHWYVINERNKIKTAVVFVTKIILFLVSIIGLIIITYSKELLNIWINKEYAINSYIILQILTIGVLFNTLSVIPFRTLSAIGFQKVAAMVYIIETPITILLVYILIKNFGIKGGAIGYDIRAFLEMVMFYYLLSKDFVKLNLVFNLYKIAIISIGYLFFYLLSFLIAIYLNNFYKFVFIFMLLLTVLFFQFFIVFNNEDKYYIYKMLKKIKGNL